MYYILKNDDNPKIVGSDYPQAWKFTKEYDEKCDEANGIYSFYKKIHNNERPDFVPDLGGLVLSGRAKLTDIVSTSVLPRLHMNEVAKEVFSSCNLGDYEFYNAQLYLKKAKILTQILDYFYLCPFTDIFDYIYLPETLFRVDKYSPERQQLFIEGFSSYQAYTDFITKNIDVISPTKITMNEGFDKTLDYFIIPNLNIYRGIASEKLKTKIEAKGITGLKFEPIEIIFK